MTDAATALRRVLGSGRRSGDEILFNCPFCSHHKPKLSINCRSYAWKCWVCDAKGVGLRSLFKRLGRPDLAPASPVPQYVPKHEETQAFRVCLPEEFKPLAPFCHTFQARRAYNYVRSRGISDKEILFYKIGFASYGKYRDRVIFPSFDEEGDVNFFTARCIGNSPIKYLSPSTPKGYKSTVIFNELNVNWKRPVVLVEGFVDAIRAGRNAIPLCGSVLAHDSKLLHRLAVEDTQVYVALDPDARDKQLNILAMLYSYGIEAFDVNVSPYKDVGEMPLEAFRRQVTEARPASRVSILRERIHHI